MAGVLKAHSLSIGTGDIQPIAFNLQDVAEQAQKQLDEVRRQAQAIVAQAQIDAERIRKEAAEHAKRDALLEMEAKVQQRSQELATKQTAEATTQLKQVTESLRKDTQTWLDQWQAQTVLLATAIAEKIVRRRIESDITIVTDWIADTISQLRGVRQVELRLHPRDAARLKSNLETMLNASHSSLQWTLTEDPSMQSGGCIVRSELGEFDWQLSTQLKRLEEQLA